MSTAVRQQLLEPFRHPEQATTEVFRAACRVLLTATLHHPSLQDLLLFPTGLTSAEDAAGGKVGECLYQESHASASAMRVFPSIILVTIELLKNLYCRYLVYCQ